MHRALEIQEILLNIFCYCFKSDLSALARACQAFKEPALDVLWEELYNLSPLAQCLPEASHLSTPMLGVRSFLVFVALRLIANLSPQFYFERYSFGRLPTPIEWDILQNYTRRIRFIRSFEGLCRKSIQIISKPPATQPLFPNLCHVQFEYGLKGAPLLLSPLPSLVSIDLEVDSSRFFHNSLESFAKFPPSLKRLSIRTRHRTAVDVNSLVHLSRLPALSRFEFSLGETLPDQISPSDIPLCFPNLHDLTVHCDLLDPISRLLSLARPDAITIFSSFFESCPSKDDVSSFFASVKTSGIGRTIQGLWWGQKFPFDSATYAPRKPSLVLGLEDLQPCMAFGNLQRIRLDVQWRVDLTDSELLTLASAWPRLEDIYINDQWGWNTLGGITPNGLLQFLQTCQSLCRVGLVIDTRGFTKVPESPESFGFTLLSHINVIDSRIEAESVPAITAFLAGILSSSHFSFVAWESGGMKLNPDRKVYIVHWNDVYKRVKDAVRHRS